MGDERRMDGLGALGAVTLVGAGALLALALGAWVTGGVLVDDAYIHLRYARNAVDSGAFVYNEGEPVFGLTSPLFGLFCAALYALFGTGVERAVLACNALLFATAAWLASRTVEPRARLPLLAALLFWPSLVDNQLLGMETPLFVALVVAAMGAALRGRALPAALAYGFALVTRPEAVLLAPFLLAAGSRAWGGLRPLARLAVLGAVLLPGLAWCAFALTTYGSVIPQSMLAKTGWNSEHYDSLFTLRAAWLAVPRLTFLPFVDRFPAPLAMALAAATVVLVLLVSAANVRAGTRASRLWLAYYLVYVAFFVLGKGATEASWYSVPSTVALLLASEPLLARVKPVPAFAAAVTLASASVACAWMRAPLLRSYVDGYGASAAYLNEHAPAGSSVLIGEIGVFGFESRHRVIDVGALVSPEVLPLKNAGSSLCGIVRATGADFAVISEVALETNAYPSVGLVWRDDEDRAWFDAHCRELARHAGKVTFAVERGVR